MSEIGDKKERLHSGPLVLTLGLVLAMGLGLISIHVPFGRDQGVSAYVAEVMARGGLIYKDVYHFNLPAIFFTYGLAARLPLSLVEAVNLVHLVFTGLTYLAVYAAARTMLRPLASAFASIFYGGFAVVMYTAYWDVAQKESLACLPLSLALLFFLKSVPGEDNGESAGIKIVAFAFLAGLFSGFAAQYKPTLGIVVLVCIQVALARRRQKPGPITAILATGAGFALSFLPLLIYLVSTGTLSAMLESVIRFGGFYGGQKYGGLAETISNVIQSLIKWAIDWRFLAVLAGASLALDGRSSVRLRVALVFAALLLLQIVIQMKFFTYHWIPLLLPLSVMSAWGAAALLSSISLGSSRTRASRLALLALLAALFIGSLNPDSKRYYREYLYDAGKIERNNFLAAYGKWGGGDICQMAAEAVSEYVSGHSTPSDGVLVFGLEPALYLMMNRFPPTRFAYDQPLTADPAGNLDFQRYRDVLRAEFMASLQKRPPKYIIIIENDATAIEPLDSAAQARAFTEFWEMIERDYYLETKIEDYFVYGRLDETGLGKGPG